MKKIVLTFGLISGAVLSAMMLATLPFQQRIDVDLAIWVGYATMVAAGLMIYFGIRRYRDTVGGGRVSFGRAFGVGMLIAVVSSLCYTATWEAAYFGGLYPDFMATYQSRVLEKARERGTPPAEIEAMKADMDVWARRYENPAINSAITFFEPMPVGLLVSLVSAAALSRRRRRGAEHAMETRVA